MAVDHCSSIGGYLPVINTVEDGNDLERASRLHQIRAQCQIEIHQNYI